MSTSARRTRRLTKRGASTCASGFSTHAEDEIDAAGAADLHRRGPGVLGGREVARPSGSSSSATPPRARVVGLVCDRQHRREQHAADVVAAGATPWPSCARSAARAGRSGSGSAKRCPEVAAQLARANRGGSEGAGLAPSLIVGVGVTRRPDAYVGRRRQRCRPAIRSRRRFCAGTPSPPRAKVAGAQWERNRQPLDIRTFCPGVDLDGLAEEGADALPAGKTHRVERRGAGKARCAQNRMLVVLRCRCGGSRNAESAGFRSRRRPSRPTYIEQARPCGRDRPCRRQRVRDAARTPPESRSWQSESRCSGGCRRTCVPLAPCE